jgi:hypothetical protein
MKYNNENQIKEALGIESWRNLPKDKILQFSAMMPEMDNEVMMKIIDQFPEFRIFAKEILDNAETTFLEALKANQSNQENLHQSFTELRSLIAKELSQEGVSFEEKKYYIEKVMECLNIENKKDSENKVWISKITTKALMTAGGLVLAAIVFVGGKVILGKNNND